MPESGLNATENLRGQNTWMIETTGRRSVTLRWADGVIPGIIEHRRGNDGSHILEMDDAAAYLLREALMSWETH